MSKASEWATLRRQTETAHREAEAAQPQHSTWGLNAYVTNDGYLRLTTDRDMNFEPEHALLLGRWIIDTFSDPPAPEPSERSAQ